MPNPNEKKRTNESSFCNLRKKRVLEDQLRRVINVGKIPKVWKLSEKEESQFRSSENIFPNQNQY